jgi:prephenate dehydrogenase
MSTLPKPKIAIIGYGQFGQFMAKHLKPYFTVVPIKRDTDPKKVATCDIVIFAVPWSGLETAITTLKPYIQKEALILDVTSVKQKPLALLTKHFPTHEILGTHPIFGPQSGKHGLTGLPIVLCNISFTKPHYTAVTKFLKQTLKLQVIEETAIEHDTEMARVQGLTHFIGRALLQLDIKSYATNTKSYAQLLELKRLLANDSWELFTTIQNTNPEAKIVRKELLTTLAALERDLSKK